MEKKRSYLSFQHTWDFFLSSVKMEEFYLKVIKSEIYFSFPLSCFFRAMFYVLYLQGVRQIQQVLVVQSHPCHPEGRGKKKKKSR